MGPLQSAPVCTFALAFPLPSFLRFSLISLDTISPGQVSPLRFQKFYRKGRCSAIRVGAAWGGRFIPCAPGAGAGAPLVPGAENKGWCGRRESNPQGPKPGGFSYLLRLSPPGSSPGARMRFGVWTIPSPCPGAIPGVRRCPSSLYTFPAGRPCPSRAWLGITISQASPSLGSSTSPVSRRALRFVLSPLRLPIPPRPRGYCHL